MDQISFPIIRIGMAPLDFTHARKSKFGQLTSFVLCSIVRGIVLVQAGGKEPVRCRISVFLRA